MRPKTVGWFGGGYTTHIAEEYRGLMADSIILTLKGEISIADVRPDDRVITRDTGMAVVRNVRSRHIQTDAVRIKAGSLGHTRPKQDVILPAGQPILIRDWRAQALFKSKQALIPARRLVDGEFVTLQRDVSMNVHEIEFDRPHVLYVDGIEVAGHLTPAIVAEAA